MVKILRGLDKDILELRQAFGLGKVSNWPLTQQSTNAGSLPSGDTWKEQQNCSLPAPSSNVDQRLMFNIM